MTRRQLRAYRAAQDQAVRPVPLQAPTPQSSDRTVADVLDTVAVVEGRQHADAPATPRSSGRAAALPDAAAVRPDAAAARPDVAAVPSSAASDSGAAPVAGASPVGADPSAAAAGLDAPTDDAGLLPSLDDEAPADAAAVEQATIADGSPDAVEPLEEAAEHGEEPRRRRSTWAPHVTGDDQEPPTGDADVSTDVPPVDEAAPVPRLPLPSELPSPREPVVFPLDLEADTNEVPTPAPALEDEPSESPGSSVSSAPSVSAALPVSSVPSAPSALSVPSDSSSEGLGSSESTPQRTRPAEPKPVTTAFEAPAGHWSRQGEQVDDQVHESETGIRRITDTSTGALILPNSALGDVTGALNATGEVILTGSIDLPKSLSSTGSHRPIDGAEVDRLLDQHDEQPETDASPVRASRAVSSHTSTRAVVLAAAKPKQSRGPLVLAWSATGIGVIAAGAIVYALIGIH